MVAGDETRPDNRPARSVFDDGRPADETRLNPVPPPRPPAGRRSPVEPPGERPPAAYGVQPSEPYDQQYGGGPGGGGATGGGLFDDERGGAGQARPTILANQAGEWERNLQEVEVVRGSRTGLIALFVLALVAVIVIALGLAAWSVLTGGDDEAGVDAGATDGTEADAGTDADGTTPTSITESSTTTETVPTTAPFDPATDLRVTVAEDPFVCDGGTREFALIGNADPNENVAFASPQADGLRSGTADANGELPIRWQCDPEQAGTTWQLTATGETSGRTATFLFAGVTTAPDPDQPVPTQPIDPVELTVELIENPFACDGGTRVFAGLSGLEPNETVAFSSPQSPGLRAGTADADGNLPVRWQCDADQVGTTWDLTATGETSGRTVTFSFTGS
ncbi:MAG: hypothetical protein AAGA93_18800 [Actinomycetota bacterium]